MSCNSSNFLVFPVVCAGPSNAAQFFVSLTTAPRCQAHGSAVITGETVGFPMGMRALLGNGGIKRCGSEHAYRSEMCCRCGADWNHNPEAESSGDEHHKKEYENFNKRRQGDEQ